MFEEAAFNFRPFNEEDLAFLHDSWGSSYFKGTSARKYLSSSEFHAFHRPIRERFFGKPNTTVIVCAAADDPWHIIAWVAVELIPSGLVLHYLYVKSMYKGLGIARELLKRALPSSPVFYTHLTDRAAKILAKKPGEFGGFVHMPHLV